MPKGRIEIFSDAVMAGDGEFAVAECVDAVLSVQRISKNLSHSW
jgi:hypothetical protein